MKPGRAPVPQPAAADEPLDEETVRILTERRNDPGRLRPWREQFEKMKKAPEPQPPR